MNTEHARATVDLFCRNCGIKHELTDIQIAHAVDAVRGFALSHKRCEKPTEPSKQAELFDALVASERKLTDHPGVPFPEPTREELNATSVSVAAERFRRTRSIEVVCQRCHKTLTELGVTLGDAEEHYRSCCGSGIDCSSDEPAPEIDPPGAHTTIHDGFAITTGTIDEIFPDEVDADGNPIPPPAYPQFADPDYEPPVDHYSKFVEMYPWPPDVPTLRQALRKVLTPEQDQALRAQPLPPPDTAAFQLMAAWVRIQEAHLDSQGRGIGDAIAGLTIPARLPMPEALKKLLSPPKRKRGARPLANPTKKRKAAS
jgi:hypothetical protein